MAETAILQPSKPLVPGARGPQRDAPGGQGGGEGAEAAFASLLVAVEQIAAQGDRVIAPTRAAGAVAEGQGTAAQILARLQGEGPSSLVRDLQRLAQGEGAGRQEAGPAAPVRPLQQAGMAPDLPRAPSRSDFQIQLPLMQPGGQNPADPALVTVEEARLPQQAQPKLQSGEGQIASVPRLEAALQQHASQETSNPVVRQVATNLQVVARGEMERIRFDLYPEDLGRVHVQLQKNGGVTRLTIVTETPQAFEALARGATALQLNLGQAGFETDDLVFEQREEREGQERPADERQERPDRRLDGRDQQEERREVMIRPAGREDRGLFL